MKTKTANKTAKRKTMSRELFESRCRELRETEARAMSLWDEVLVDCGWKRSNDNPAKIWLWSKKINGKLVAVDSDVALQIQDSILCK